MLIDKLKNTAAFTKNEKMVATYILNNLDAIEHMTSKQLAQVSFTSKSTVVRLCQKLGLSGYQEFRLKLIAELNQQKRLNVILAREPIQQNTSMTEIIQIIPNIYDKVITDTTLTFNLQSINRLLQHLKNADEIHIYATGIAYHLAQAASFKFSTLGYHCQSFESINTHFLAKNKEKKCVSFLISFTGANKTVTQMGKYLNTATNHYLVGILGPHFKQFQTLCNEIIEIPNRDSVLNLDVIRSSCALNYVFDILFSCLLTLNYKHHVASSYQILPFNTHLLTEIYGLK